MAVNKNFVVKNGLEVNDDLIMANSSNSRVGIGTSVPHYTLHAFGGIGASNRPLNRDIAESITVVFT